MDRLRMCTQPNDCSCLSPHCCSPVRCHGPPLHQLERSLLPVHAKTTHRPRRFYVQTSDSLFGFPQTCRKKNLPSHRPITSKPKLQDSSFFLLFILCMRIVKIFVLCWCVHIAYVSIQCPVDIVLFNLDFTDLYCVHITCGVGERRKGVLSNFRF